MPELRLTVAELGLRVVGANAYLGVEAILPALDEQPHLVITGRLADPSIYLAPLVHRYGWKLDDWQHLGAGTAIGHLLECTTQVTGGYFADPPYKVVSNIAHLGFPLAEVEPDGSGIITKLQGTVGMVTVLTVKEQLLYEVHNPAAYFTPDVTADFSRARVTQAGADRVQIANATGSQRPEKLKAIVGFDGGFLAEAEFSYAGLGAVARCQIAADIVQERTRAIHHCQEPWRLDMIGVSALLATAKEAAHASDAQDVRLRAALHTSSREMAENLLQEVESLWLSGPAGGGGYRGTITPAVSTQTIFVDRNLINIKVEMLQS